MNSEREAVKTGAAAAAIVAAGIGCASLGVFTTMAEASPGVKNFLNWWDPAGPLTGKTGMSVAIWLAAWILLHLVWKDRGVSPARALSAAMILIGLGVAGTFPVFFQLFSAH